MRDIINPFLLLVVVVLIACRTAFGGAVASACDLWALVVCCTSFVVDLSLGLARAFMHRESSLMKVVWAVVFFLLGSSVFMLPGASLQAVEPEEAELQELLASYRKDPAFIRGEQAQELVVVAASTGKTHLLREMLNVASVEGNKPLLSAALQEAAEKGHLSVVELLVPHVGLNETVQGGTPLVAAASAGRVRIVEQLLAAGADPNLPDSAGTPPIIHAVLADSPPCVKLLLQNGADPTRCDADGRDAASYSRNGEIDDLLSRQ